MPARVEKITKGKNKGKFKVVTPEGTTAEATTEEKAKKQARLLNAIAHGFKPRR